MVSGFSSNEARFKTLASLIHAPLLESFILGCFPGELIKMELVVSHRVARA